MIRLGQLLTYLSRIEVSEIVVGSGRPVTIRSAGAYKPLTSAPVTTGQIMELVRGTELEPLIPNVDTSGTPRDISLSGGIYRATIARRGDALFVKIERSDEANARETDRVPLDKVPTRVVERNMTQHRDPEARDRGPVAGRTQPLHLGGQSNPTPTNPLTTTSSGPAFPRPGSSSGNHPLRQMPSGSTPEQIVPPTMPMPTIAFAPAPRLATPAPRAAPDLFVTLVHEARRRGATDLHLAAGQPPQLRTAGQLRPGNQSLDAAAISALLEPMLGQVEQASLAERGYADLALDVRGSEPGTTSRVRGRISKARNGLRASFRLVWAGVPTLDALGLPSPLAKVASFRQGIVIVASPSGHGKTTTLAALVDVINASRPHHIVCIEDPIEVVHPRKVAVVSQRAIGQHTLSIASAVEAALHADADVIVIGELRCRETVELALAAAESGHLVLCTMTGPNAGTTVERTIEMFPPADHARIRASLASALRLVVAQRLLPAQTRDRLVPAVELTIVRPRDHAIGAIRFDDSLADLVRAGAIDEPTAMTVAENPKELSLALGASSIKETQKMGFLKRRDS